MRPAALALPSLIALATCGAPRPAPDAASDAMADADAAPVAPMPPAPPAPPVLTPCPPGWRSVTSATGVETCDPWPETGYRTDCAWDEAHWPGTPGCARIGTPCPADGWPEGLPAGRAIVYVDEDAAPGGDGSSRTRAYRTIAEATAAARSGAIVAIATGRYDEAVRVGAGVTVWGACVSGTRIVTTAPSETDAALTFVGSGAGARNLAIDAPERYGVVSIGREGVSVEAVVVQGARIVGLYVSGGSTAVRDVVVRGTRERASDLTLGRGINVQDGAHVTLSRAVAEDNRDCGMFASRADTSIEATEIAVHGTRERASDHTAGRGIDVQAGAHIGLSRAAVEDNREHGVFASRADSSIDATDVVVRATRERASDRTRGRGVNVQDGAHATLLRVVVEDSREAGVAAAGAATSVQATDVVVRGTRERGSDRTRGRGFEVGEGAHATLSRAVIEDNHEQGVLADGIGTFVEATDVVVRGTRESASGGTDGGGIHVQDSARAMLSRALVEDNRDVGIFADGINTRIEATDALVRDTMPQEIDGSGGAGVWSQRGAWLVLARVQVERSHMVGIASVGVASVEASNVSVSGVVSSRCRPSWCMGNSGGFGLVANYGGTVRVTRFAVVGATLCGVLLGGSRANIARTGIDLESGVIERSAVGACVQVDGYDLSRLRRDVQYREVGLPTQATSYSLPEAL